GPIISAQSNGATAQIVQGAVNDRELPLINDGLGGVGAGYVRAEVTSVIPLETIFTFRKGRTAQFQTIAINSVAELKDGWFDVYPAPLWTPKRLEVQILEIDENYSCNRWKSLGEPVVLPSEPSKYFVTFPNPVTSAAVRIRLFNGDPSGLLISEIEIFERSPDRDYTSILDDTVDWPDEDTTDGPNKEILIGPAADIEIIWEASDYDIPALNAERNIALFDNGGRVISACDNGETIFTGVYLPGRYGELALSDDGEPIEAGGQLNDGVLRYSNRIAFSHAPGEINLRFFRKRAAMVSQVNILNRAHSGAGGFREVVLESAMDAAGPFEKVGPTYLLTDELYRWFAIEFPPRQMRYLRIRIESLHPGGPAGITEIQVIEELVPGQPSIVDLESPEKLFPGSRNIAHRLLGGR
ncbi:MAG: hypothetical protein N2C12_11565, partial [Planctomycetales bacterium]